jgi:6-phosphogluconolactonase
MSYQTISEKDPTLLFNRTAAAIVAHLGPLAAQREIMIGLCGGRSVVGLVHAIRDQALNKTSGNQELSQIFEKAKFLIIDERLVPLSHPDSNYGMLDNSLFKDLVSAELITPSQLFPFIPDEKNADFGTAAYSKQFEALGGSFDLVVLGVGEDGHVAGLFPQHPTLNRNEKVFLSFFDSPKPPAARMTATLPILQDAGATVMLFTGEAKRSAWERFNDSTTSPYDCPSIFMKECRNLIVATDLLG